ncbi:hypothetical protein DSUL_20024 [Desulfovibrionales bacterium]
MFDKKQVAVKYFYPCSWFCYPGSVAKLLIFPLKVEKFFKPATGRARHPYASQILFLSQFIFVSSKKSKARLRYRF